MIVLGRPYKTVGPQIEIPPFHTGHLGLVPDTEVNLFFISPTKEGKCNCEVIVTPLQRKPDSIMQITAVMHDKPGVVSRLLRSISDLGINILVEESSSINHLNHHHVNLLIDWSTSQFNNDAGTRVSPSTQRRYQKFQSIFPVQSKRCVVLFNSIVARCADVLDWDDAAIHPIPKLHFRQLGMSKSENSRSHVVVARASNKKYFGSLSLPLNLFAEIRQRVGYENDEQVPFLMLSDTEDRALRLFFPTEDENARLVHVAFVHNDLPGALAAITSVVAQADFSVLTSLHRRKTGSRSVWEAVLECPKEMQLPARTEKAADVSWSKLVIEMVAKKFLEASTPEDIHRLRLLNIEVCQPAYPAVRNSVSFQLQKELANRESRTPQDASSLSLANALLEESRKQPNDITVQRQRDLLNLVITEERVRPRVFVSYPRTASEHGDMLCEKIVAANFDAIRYQIPDGTVIVDEVLHRIEDCDYFVGIWHPDDLSNAKAVSPWMPFEYGIALALRRQCVIVHSKRLDKSVRQRISPEVAQAEYSDVRFESETCPLVIENLKQYHSHAK